MAYGNTFKRYEKKFLLDRTQYAAMRRLLEPYMTEDSYGLSTICNVYCDSQDWSLIRASIEKPIYKEKVRLRTYGIPTNESTAFLEIKKKYKGIVYKRRIELPYIQAWNYLTKGTMPDADTQIMREIDYCVKSHNLAPAVFIAYDRIALYGKENKEFRITFDTNIRSRFDNISLTKGDYGQQLCDKKIYIMEIKVDSAMPMWMTEILSSQKIYSSSFSKYGNIYKEMITENKRSNLCSQVS